MARQRRVDDVVRDVRVVDVLLGKSGRVGALRQGLGVRQVREVGVRRRVQLCRPRCLGERCGQRARGVVAPYRVHVLEGREGDEPDAAVDRDSLRPGDVVVARRVGSRGYRARQRHQREQRRSRQLGDGRRAGSGRAHRASRPGASPITHPAPFSHHRHRCPLALAKPRGPTRGVPRDVRPRESRLPATSVEPAPRLAREEESRTPC